VKFVKKQNPQAISYLLLKDIFPQNAVDIGMFGKNSLFYRMFRKKEVDLYKNSDFIGCMSPANVKFVIEHNNFIEPNRVEVAPNSIEIDFVISRENLLGEPAIGRRFKGNIWLQGEVESI
jgi:hypothetical protein